MGEPNYSHDPDLKSRVASYEDNSNGSYNLRLHDGTTMVVNADGAPVGSTYDIRVQTPQGWHLGGSGQNVHAPGAVPSGLRDSGHAGEQVNWDLKSLGDAQNWLRQHAEYLGRLYHAMSRIRELIDGPAGVGMPAVGAFPKATELYQKHTQLYESFRDGLKTSVDGLYDTADALGKVMENYDTAEKRNALNAAEWQSIFAKAAEVQHNV